MVKLTEVVYSTLGVSSFPVESALRIAEKPTCVLLHNNGQWLDITKHTWGAGRKFVLTTEHVERAS
jgi:hypothetical protein